jgi:serine/threonine-protein kinase ULK/ATG1
MVNNEINIMNMIKENTHPNVVKCVDTLQTQKCAYIVMELCDSGDLSTIMTKPIREVCVKSYFAQLINGLRFLHLHNFIHRDLKPRNILLTNNKKILKIADFGFAKIVKEQLLKEKMCGSPLYMAPEIMNNDIYNNQSDLWSVGLILYEMLYGTHPYESCKTLNDLKTVVNTTSIKIPPNKSNINISNECIDLLQKLLQKNVYSRITWEEFFSNSWTYNCNSDIPTNIYYDELENSVDNNMNNNNINNNINNNMSLIKTPNKTISNNITIKRNYVNPYDSPIYKMTPNSVTNTYSSGSYSTSYGTSYGSPFRITTEGTPENIIKIIHPNINVIENYYSNDTNSPVVKVNNHITDSYIFDMEFPEECQVKKINLF